MQTKARNLERCKRLHIISRNFTNVRNANLTLLIIGTTFTSFYQTCLPLWRYSKLVLSTQRMGKITQRGASWSNTIRVMKFFILRTYRKPLSLSCLRNIVNMSFGARNKSSCWLISASDCIGSSWLTLTSVFISPTGLCLVCFGVYAPYFVLFAGNDWVKHFILQQMHGCYGSMYAAITPTASMSMDKIEPLM